MIIGGWQRLGIVVSVTWLLLTSWGYFYELHNHPSQLATYVPHAAYEWVDDLEATQKAHMDAQARGKDFSDRFVFGKPTFNAYGFIKLTLMPIVLAWLGVYLVLWTFRWVRKGFEI